MAEPINILESLKAQHAQLKQLLDLKLWIGNAPKPTLSEMTSQIAQIKSIIAELEELIRQQQK